MSESIVRKHIYFSGDVQGVGFRFRSYYIAQSLGLTGWVENMWDGRVEMEVQGSESAIQELLARIRVALKKHRADTAQSTGARSAGKLHMEPASYSAGYGDEPINLTKKEFDLLNYLWQHENTAITRDDLLTNVWGYEFTGDTNIVDVYIRYLRQKIDDRFGIKTIHTIRAVGYMFRYEQE